MRWNDDAWILGGYQDDEKSNQTWRANLPALKEWVRGPTLRRTSYIKCGLIANHGLLFVMGGLANSRVFKELKTSDVIKSTKNGFVQGIQCRFLFISKKLRIFINAVPGVDLPMKLDEVGVVSHPNGDSLILSGGYTSSFASRSILKLQCFSSDPVQCKFTKYKNKLKAGRYNHLSFFVISSDFNCTLSS